MNETIIYQHYTELPPEPLLKSLLDLHQRVFSSHSPDALKDELVYHQQRGPLLVNLAIINGRVIGFKAGYERKPSHFYSWLGCVDAAFRGRGVAQTLMQRQHDWCRQHAYQTVRTQTYNQWRNMLLINIKHGFDVIGAQQGTHGLLIVLEKRLPSTES